MEMQLKSKMSQCQTAERDGCKKSEREGQVDDTLLAWLSNGSLID